MLFKEKEFGKEDVQTEYFINTQQEVPTVFLKNEVFVKSSNGKYILKNDEIGNYMHSKIANADCQKKHERTLLISYDNEDFYIEYYSPDGETEYLFLVQDPRNLPNPGN